MYNASWPAPALDEHAPLPPRKPRSATSPDLFAQQAGPSSWSPEASAYNAPPVPPVPAALRAGFRRGASLTASGSKSPSPDLFFERAPPIPARPVSMDPRQRMPEPRFDDVPPQPPRPVSMDPPNRMPPPQPRYDTHPPTPPAKPFERHRADTSPPIIPAKNNDMFFLPQPQPYSPPPTMPRPGLPSSPRPQDRFPASPPPVYPPMPATNGLDYLPDKPPDSAYTPHDDMSLALALSVQEADRAAQIKQMKEDEEMARALAESLVMSPENTPSGRADQTFASQQLTDDERLARQLAIEEAEQAESKNEPESVPRPSSGMNNVAPSPTSGQPPPNAIHLPPGYDEVFGPQPAATNSAMSSPDRRPASLPRSSSYTAGMSDTSHASGMPSPPVQGEFSRATSLGSGQIVVHSPRPSSFNALSTISSSYLGDSLRPPSAGSTRTSTSESAIPTPSASSSVATPPAASGSTPSISLDRVLLLGVTLGFQTPLVEPDARMFSGAIPNLITLPPGISPPFHIQSLDWRRMLRLLAALDSSRLEPSVEALAITKGDLKLRTVIQFRKVPYSNPGQWRTILHLTMDHPVPPNSPATWKYKNGDPSVLPYSYSLSALPPGMAASQDSHLYTVPVTDTCPLPSLPLTLPTLARYLQAAMTESRAAMNDSSSGLRKLAKLVEAFYPQAEVDGAFRDDEGRGRLRGLFKKKKTPASGRDGNAETFDMITPFRLDQFG